MQLYALSLMFAVLYFALAKVIEILARVARDADRIGSFPPERLRAHADTLNGVALALRLLSFFIAAGTGLCWGLGIRPS